MNYEQGEIVLIDNEEYIIVSIFNCNNINYIYLTSISKPSKILIAKLLNDGNIETLNDETEIEYVLSRFNSIN